MAGFFILLLLFEGNYARLRVRKSALKSEDACSSQNLKAPKKDDAAGLSVRFPGVSKHTRKIAYRYMIYIDIFLFIYDIEFLFIYDMKRNSKSSG